VAAWRARSSCALPERYSAVAGDDEAVAGVLEDVAAVLGHHRRAMPEVLSAMAQSRERTTGPAPASRMFSRGLAVGRRHQPIEQGNEDALQEGHRRGVLDVAQEAQRVVAADGLLGALQVAQRAQQGAVGGPGEGGAHGSMTTTMKSESSLSSRAPARRSSRAFHGEGLTVAAEQTPPGTGLKSRNLT